MHKWAGQTWPGRSRRCTRGSPGRQYAPALALVCDPRRLANAGLPTARGSSDAAHRRAARVAAQGPGRAGQARRLATEGRHTAGPALPGQHGPGASGTARSRVSGQERWRKRGPDPARGRGAARPSGTAPGRKAATPARTGGGGGGAGQRRRCRAAVDGRQQAVARARCRPARFGSEGYPPQRADSDSCIQSSRMWIEPGQHIKLGVPGVASAVTPTPSQVSESRPSADSPTRRRSVLSLSRVSRR